MKNEIAKAICIASIWISMSIVFSFGIFDFQWAGGFSQIILLVISLGLLGITFATTLLVLKSANSSDVVAASEANSLNN